MFFQYFHVYIVTFVRLKKLVLFQEPIGSSETKTIVLFSKESFQISDAAEPVGRICTTEYY